MAEERRTGFLDPRAWKLADVVIIGALLFNFGVSHRAQADIEALVTTNAADIKANALAEAIELAKLRAETQRLRERVARLEEKAGVRAAGGGE